MLKLKPGVSYIKLIMTAPSADGINGDSIHRDYVYLLNYPSSTPPADWVEKEVTKFVMKTGVNRDMVTITIETEEDSHE